MMLNLGQQEKDLILEIVREALAGEPEELEVFNITGEEILREAVSQQRSREADSDMFFGGLEHSLSELMMHLVVLAAAEAIKHGVLFSRDRIKNFLAERRRKGTPESPELAHAEELLVIVMSRAGDDPVESKKGNAKIGFEGA